MNKWLLEHKISFNTLFVENMNQSNKRYLETFKKGNCSSLNLFYHETIKSLKDYSKNTKITLLGSHVNHYTGTIRFKMDRMFGESLKEDSKMSIRLRNTGCSDNTTLFLILESNKSFSYYYSVINMCCVLRNLGHKKNNSMFYNENYINFKKVEFNKNGYFISISNDDINIPYKIYNLKGFDCSLHYCFKEAETDFNKGPIMKYSMDGNICTFNVNRCIFCFRKYQNFSDLQYHFKRIHLNYDVKSDDNKIFHIKDVNLDLDIKKSETLFLLKKKDGQLYLKYLNGVNYENNQIFFMSYKCKRYREISFKKLKIVHYRPETMVNYEIKKYSTNFINFLSEKRLNELVDVDKRQLNMMKKWNVFILNQKTMLNHDNISLKVLEFLLTESDLEEGFNFLIVLFNKCILSQSEIQRILMKLTESVI